MSRFLSYVHTKVGDNDKWMHSQEAEEATVDRAGSELDDVLGYFDDESRVFFILKMVNFLHPAAF